MSVVLRRNPIVGVAGCCPCATNGPAAAPPSPAINSRRLIALSPPISLAFDVGRLDDRPPLVGLRLLKRAQGVRRLLLARRRIDPEVGEALARLLARQRFEHRRIQPRDDLLRRILRRPQSVPKRRVEALKSRLFGGGDAARGAAAFARRD